MKRVAVAGTTIVSGLMCVGLVAGTLVRAQPLPESKPGQAQAVQAGQAQAVQAGQAQGVQPGPTPTTAPAPQRQASPAVKALNEASAIKDIDEKIAAIQKVIVDFPKTPQVDQANTLLLDALIKKGDIKRVQDQAKSMVEAAPDSSRYRIQRDVATALLRGDVLLEDAECVRGGGRRIARREELHRGAQEGGRGEGGHVTRPGRHASSAPPAAAEPTATAVAAPCRARHRAGPATTCTSRGSRATSSRRSRRSARSTSSGARPPKPRRRCGRRTSSTRPPRPPPPPALKLAEYAKAAGRDDEQFDYLTGVALAGRLTPEALRRPPGGLPQDAQRVRSTVSKKRSMPATRRKARRLPR